MEKHLAQMVRNRAARYGERTVFRVRKAGTKEYQTYSWNEFVKLSDSVAKALIAEGYSRGAMIGIFSDNKPQWTIADIGILSMRGVVVPFFSTASLEQLKYIVDETGMELLFASNQDQLEKATWLLDNTNTLKKVVCFDPSLSLKEDSRISKWDEFLQIGQTEALSGQLKATLDAIEANDLATVIYTSGTTGEPKGVMLGHDNFMSCMQIHDDRLSVSEQDVSLCFLPLSHIFERAWTFYMLYKGAENVFLENPKTVIEELPLAKPTFMCTVPRFFEKTYDAISAEKAKWPAVKRQIFEWSIRTGHAVSAFRKGSQVVPPMLRLRHFFAEALVLKKLRSIFGGRLLTMPCSGAAIRIDLLKFFHAAGIFVNYGYGASETTATVSCFKADLYEFESCGTIMPGVEVKISDEGEILVKGPTVFKGYYKKPEASQKVLKDGWYATGDSGRITAAGNLVMDDRIHDIFKTSGGKFVAPQKVELLLCSDPFIEQAVVIGDNRKFITALIVPSFPALAAQFQFDLNDPENRSEHLNKESVTKFFENRLNDIQQVLMPHERVVRFTLLHEPFSIENNVLTSTLKIRRKVIASRYHSLVEKMYSTA